MLPEAVLTNRLSDMQAEDWHEKLETQRGELARQIAELTDPPLVRRIIDLARLDNVIKNWRH
jgi:hypothetical protein